MKVCDVCDWWSAVAPSIGREGKSVTEKKKRR